MHKIVILYWEDRDREASRVLLPDGRNKELQVQGEALSQKNKMKDSRDGSAVTAFAEDPDSVPESIW